MGGALRVCFLTPGLPAASSPIGGLILRLAARDGADVAVALTEGVPPGGDALAFGDAAAVAVQVAASGPAFDVAVATDWRTTAHLFDVPATRHAFWVDALEFRRMGTWQAERFAAQLAYDLPVDFIAAGTWLAGELADLRPDARCVGMPVALDPTVFGAGDTAPDRSGGPLRVVLDDRHASGDGAAGTDEQAVVDAASAELDVVRLDPSDGPAARAAKLAGADVVLMLSAVDGALGGPLEGMACGATCIVGPAPDAGDLVEHDVNGLVADPDDVRGTARWLDTLAADRERLARLRGAASATAAAWPRPDGVASALHEVLEHFVAEEPPAASRWPSRLMSDAIGASAVFRQEIAALTGEVHRVQGDQAYRTAVAMRGKLQSPRLSPLRRVLGPLLRRLG